MHILFLTHYFPPEVNAPASRTFEHAREWVKDPAIRVTVVTNNPNHPTGVLAAGYRNRWWHRERIEGVDVVRVKTFLAPNSGFAGRTVNYVTFMCAGLTAGLFVKKPDVIVATSPQFFCAIGGFVLSWLKRKPFVFELRDLWPESIVTVGAMRPGLAVRLLEKIELLLYKKSRLVVAVTNSFKENLVRRGIDPSKIAVVRNGVELDFFDPEAASSELGRQFASNGQFVISYIGTIGMAHAVQSIVEAAAILRDRADIVFLIVGEGAEKQRVADLVASKGLNNVKMLKAVDKLGVRDLYLASQICLVTLRNQPLFKTVIPSKMFEIMAMERPILSTVDGEARAIMEEAGSGTYVEPEDPSGMAQAIVNLLGDQPALTRMGKSGREYVMKNFERRSLARDFLSLLRSRCCTEGRSF